MSSLHCTAVNFILPGCLSALEEDTTQLSSALTPESVAARTLISCSNVAKSMDYTSFLRITAVTVDLS